jgi:fibronectin type 3 domain-containing protein
VAPRGGAEPAAEEGEAAATPTPSAPEPEPDVAETDASASTPEPQPTPTPAAGIRIYRRADPGSYAEPLRAELVRENVYLDSDAPMGRSACYVARTVVSTDPLIESEASNEACLEVQDRQPPAAPGGVATLSVEGGLEISWSPSGEADLESYRVYRVLGDEPPLLVAEVKPPETRVVDEAQPPAQRVHYFVTAVDAAGNESSPSPRVEGARR